MPTLPERYLIFIGKNYLNDILFVVIWTVELVGDEAKWIKNGATKVTFGGLLLLRNSREFDSLYLFLELPVVDKGLLPFRYELCFELLWELHHFQFVLWIDVYVCGEGAKEHLVVRRRRRRRRRGYLKWGVRLRMWSRRGFIKRTREGAVWITLTLRDANIAF